MTHPLECTCGVCTERIRRTIRIPAISPNVSTEALIRELRSRSLDNGHKAELAALAMEDV